MDLGWASHCLGCNSKSLLYFEIQGSDWVRCTVCGWASQKPTAAQVKRRHIVKTRSETDDEIVLGPAGSFPKSRPK